MLSQEDKDDLETAETLAGLHKVRGWHVYLAILDKHIEETGRQVEQPCASVDQMVGLESRKGALIGLRLARLLVPRIMAHAEEIRKRAKPDEEL